MKQSGRPARSYYHLPSSTCFARGPSDLAVTLMQRITGGHPIFITPYSISSPCLQKLVLGGKEVGLGREPLLRGEAHTSKEPCPWRRKSLFSAFAAVASSVCCLHMGRSLPTDMELRESHPHQFCYESLINGARGRRRGGRTGGGLVGQDPEVQVLVRTCLAWEDPARLEGANS